MNAFLRGMARIVDLFGAIRNPAVDDILSQTDADAIGQDWQKVGMLNGAFIFADEPVDDDWPKIM